MKPFFNRATFVRDRGIIALYACCGLLGGGIFGMAIFGHKAIINATKQRIATEYMLKITEYNKEIIRETYI